MKYVGGIGLAPIYLVHPSLQALTDVLQDLGGRPGMLLRRPVCLAGTVLLLRFLLNHFA